jgi:hypothetical protein
MPIGGPPAVPGPETCAKLVRWSNAPKATTVSAERVRVMVMVSPFNDKSKVLSRVSGYFDQVQYAEALFTVFTVCVIICKDQL